MATCGRYVAPDNSDSQIWNTLSRGIEDVYAHEPLAAAEYMQLYAYFNRLVLSHTFGAEMNAAQGGDRNRQRWIPQQFSLNNRPIIRSELQVRELQIRITEFLINHLRKLLERAPENAGEDMLNFYLNQWQGFEFSSKVMNGFCSYANRRVGVRGENTRNIYRLTQRVWKENFFKPLQTPITTTVMRLIESSRNEARANDDKVKAYVGSLIELGVEREFDPLVVYRNEFEHPFIQETEKFYNLESTKFLDEGNSVSEYLKKVEQIFKEEETRVRASLHLSTMTRLIKCCENALIRNRLQRLLAEFPKLVNDGEWETVGRMFDLVSRLKDNSRTTMITVFHDHVVREGYNKICSQRNPTEFITSVLDIYQRHRDFVTFSLKGDGDFVVALDKACEVFINDNPDSSAGQPLQSRTSAEMLARYIDLLLRKGEKDGSLEDKLTQGMIMFKFLADKDIFQRYYSRLLANRLVTNLSASDEAESSMIDRLKKSCGFDYTSKLQKMFQDINVSRGLNEELRNWVKERTSILQSKPVDFSVMVLTSGSWPYTPDFQEFTLPPVLSTCMAMYLEFYVNKTHGKKLTWLHSKSRGEVVTNCFPRKYTIAVQTFGIAVLLLYNDRDSYKIHELVQATNLQEDVVVQIVQPFMKINLLKSNDAADSLSLNSEIFLEQGFASNRSKIPLVGQLRFEKKKDEEKVQRGIDSGREFECQAAIIRAMKMRRTLGHNELVAEVILGLSNRFQPNVQLIKKCILLLIEKEYLAINKNRPNAYDYLT